MRLENVDQLQWEIDAWIRHYVAWSKHCDARSRIAALNAAAQILFEEFGAPSEDDREEA
jgi:hypothetical protein